MISNFLTGLAGGVLIGLAAGIFVLFNGRIAGVSGITAGLLSRPGTRPWLEDLLFVLGLPLGATLYRLFFGAPALDLVGGPPLLVAAGLLVGFGTRLGNGCTSGHGVCGLARGSCRSLVATAVFMAAAILTVALMRHA